MTIISQNINWIPPFARRFRKLSKELFELKPDIIFLQEVVFKRYIRYFLNENYNMFYMEKRLLIWGGLVILVHKEIPVSSIQFHAFRNQGKLNSIRVAERILGKGMLEVTLVNTIKLFNTHILSNKTLDSDSNTQQIMQIHEMIDLIKDKSDNTCIFGGDLNISPNSKRFNDIKTNLPEFIELTKEITITFPKWKTKIDYIFSNTPIRNYTANTLQFGQKHPSDHLGVSVHHISTDQSLMPVHKDEKQEK